MKRKSLFQFSIRSMLAITVVGAIVANINFVHGKFRPRSIWSAWIKQNMKQFLKSQTSLETTSGLMVTI